MKNATEEQRAKLIEYRDKWRNIGLCTDPADRKTAENGIRLIYETAGFSPPEIVWGRSPAEIVSMYNAGGKEIKPLRQSVRDSVEAKAWVRATNTTNPRTRRSAMEVMLDGGQRVALVRIGEHIWSAVGDNNNMNGNLKTSVISTQHDAFWLGFYEYFNDTCHIDMSELRGQWMIAKSAGWYIPCEGICWISERPNILFVNNRWQLHCDGGTALSFPEENGQNAIYALNGIRVKPEYVLTPADKLLPEIILQEENVDIRRELLRKVGVLRMISHGKVLETWGEYKLVDMSPIFRGIPYAPFLLMKNPSLEGTWHLEGIEPECKTIAEALHRHKPEAMRKIPVDDEIGEGWFQQGDVCIWPDSAIALKRYPVILT